MSVYYFVRIWPKWAYRVIVSESLAVNRYGVLCRRTTLIKDYRRISISWSSIGEGTISGIESVGDQLIGSTNAFRRWLQRVNLPRARILCAGVEVTKCSVIVMWTYPDVWSINFSDVVVKQFYLSSTWIGQYTFLLPEYSLICKQIKRRKTYYH